MDCRNLGNSGARGTTPRPAAALGWGGRLRAGLRWRGSLDPGWQSDAGGLQEGCGTAIGLCAHGPDLAGALDRGVLQTVEVAQHVAPLRPQARLAAALVELLAQDEGEEGAEHVTPDGRVRGVVDRSR